MPYCKHLNNLLNESYKMTNLKSRFNTYINKIVFKDTYNYNFNIVKKQSILTKIIISLYNSY